jgi:hypothetical protein
MRWTSRPHARYTLESRLKMTNQALQTTFGNEMHRIYQRALSEAGYKATRFLHMLQQA